MVTANASVDIPALKARHPLGDTVEASGVRLRGRGRVRQGVCPFHEEAEGSFTVYADSERWYCFGCGLGGDVLDFIRRTENLSLPEAIRRLDGGAYPAVSRPAPARRPKAAPLPPRDPALLTAAARFYAGQLRRSPAAGLRTLPRGASDLTPPCGWASASRRGTACGRPLSRRASMPSGSGTAACSPSGVRSGSQGWWSFPTSPAGLSAGSSGGPSIPTGLPGSRRCPAPSRCLGLGVSAPRRRGRSSPRGSSTGLPLPPGASPPCAAPGHPGRRAGGDCPAGLPPGLPRLRQRRRWALRPLSGLRACLDAGPPPSLFPRASPTWPSLRPFPRAEQPSSACSHGRPAPFASGFPLPTPLPLYRSFTRSGLACGTPSRSPHPHSHHPGGPMPNSRRALPAHGFP